VSQLVALGDALLDDNAEHLACCQTIDATAAGLDGGSL
jgi:hypothetical protein